LQEFHKKWEISNGGPDNLGDPASVHIKNNIFVKKGTGDRPAMIVFNRIDPLEINTEIIDYNLYYYYNGSTSYTVKLYFSKDNSMRDWNYYDINNAKGIVGLDPLFVSTASSDYKYNLQNSSPAKNFGLPIGEVQKDIRGYIRPYWPNGVDLGAFEIPEAQMRFGVENAPPTEEIYHYTEAIGTFWEKTESGWPISDDPNIANNFYKTTGNSSTNKDEWDGFYFQWMKSLVTSTMGHAFYKITNNHSNAFFYIDFRDAVTNYNPNIYIKYDYSASKYRYWNGFTFPLIDDGSILRVWQINTGEPNTYSLSDGEYWSYALLRIDEGNNPVLIWGPYTASGTVIEYRLQKSGIHMPGVPPANFYPLYSGGSFFYKDTEAIIGNDYNAYSYRTKALIIDTEEETNIVEVRLARPSKLPGEENYPLLYKLEQNFPNPFNPVTTISFSLPDENKVKLTIYDILGAEVKILINDNLSSGLYEVQSNAENLASGIYFYNITAGKFCETKKFQLLK
jgi:hypothetical protein